LLIFGKVTVLKPVVDLIERFAERGVGPVEIPRELLVLERIESLGRLVAVRAHGAAHLPAEVPVAIREAFPDVEQSERTQLRTQLPANQLLMTLDHAPL
jgi:hypothetical protein